MAPSHLELVPTKFSTRRRRPKSKLGCSTCLRRKIKCDEHFPDCHNCTKRKRCCGYRDIQEQANRDIFSLISEDDFNEACKWVMAFTSSTSTDFASDTSRTTTVTESSPTSSVTMTESSPTYTSSGYPTTMETPATSPLEIEQWNVDWCYVTQFTQKQ